jgi:flavin reductase (DIM6/NTAB) family NADH-FMN oxidoreductase RutF
VTDARLPGRGKELNAASGSFGGIASGASARGVGSAPRGSAQEPTGAAMRAARRRWATGVGVLTTLEGEELAFRGATVSSFAVLSLEPPLVTIALEHGSRMAETIAVSGVFAVSVLDRAHEFQSDRFSGYGPRPDARFTGIPPDTARSGCPTLRGSLAGFDCTVVETVPLGDHLLVVGRVEAVGVGEDTDDPLLSYEGAYRRIEGA